MYKQGEMQIVGHGFWTGSRLTGKCGTTRYQGEDTLLVSFRRSEGGRKNVHENNNSWEKDLPSLLFVHMCTSGAVRSAGDFVHEHPRSVS